MQTYPIQPIDLKKFILHFEDLKKLLVQFEYRSGFIQRLKDGYGIIHTPRRTLPYADERSELLLSLFSDNKTFSNEKIESIIGLNLFHNLTSDGFFSNTGDSNFFGSTFRIIPVNQFFILIPFRQFNNPPVYIGADSLTFARHIQYLEQPKNILDLATGSGFQLFNLPWQTSSTTMKGLDINPNAVQTGLLNADINKTPWITFSENNIESELNSLNETYDLVIGNPPIIPTPDSELIKTRLGGMIHADGGRDGFSVARSILGQIHTILTENGSLQLILCSLGNEKGPFIVDELNSLLQSNRLTGTLVVIKKIPTELDAYYRGQKDIKEYDRWVKFYREEDASFWYRLILRAEKTTQTTNLRILELIRSDFSKLPNTERITIDTIKPKIPFYLADTIIQNQTFEQVNKFAIRITSLLETENWKFSPIREFGILLFEKLPELFKTEGAAIRFWGQCTNEFWWKPKYLERVLW